MEFCHCRYYALVILFCFIACFNKQRSYGQANTSSKFDQLLDSAEYLKLKGYLKESINISEEVRRGAILTKDWSAYVRSIGEHTDALRFDYYYTKDPKTLLTAKNLLSQADSIIANHLPDKTLALSRYNIYKGKLIKDATYGSSHYDPDTLQYYFNLAYKIIQTQSASGKEAAKLYYELGHYYYSQSNVKLAEQFYGLLLKELSRFDALDYFRAYYLFRANRFYFDIADYEKSLLCSSIALDIFEKPRYNDLSNALKTRNDIANAYFNSNMLNREGFQKALSYYKDVYNALSNSQTNSSFASLTLYNMGATYFEMGEYDSCYQSFKMFLTGNPMNSLYDSMRMAKTHKYFGLIELEKGDESSAQTHFQKAQSHAQKLVGNKDYDLHVILRDIGFGYAKSGNYDVALEYYQDGLAALFDDFNSKNIRDNPQWRQSENIEPVLYILFYKAGALYERYLEQKNLADLQSAHQLYQEGFELLKSLLKTQKMTDSFIMLFQNFKGDFQTAVACAVMAHSQFDDPEYLNTGFAFIEQSKYFLLLKSLQNTRLKDNLGANSELFLKERTLNAEIEKLNHMLSLVDIHNNDSFHLKNQLLEKVVQYDELRHQLEKSAQDPLQSHLLSLDEIQKDLIDEDELVIEYYWGKNDIFIISISNKDISVIKTPITSELENQISSYKELLADKDLSTLAFNKYKHSSYYLYRHLFQPVMDLRIGEGKKEFTIIADGMLTYLPFEAFTTKLSGNEQVNYWNLPYLVREVNINYAFSLNILYNNLKKPVETGTNSVLAMSYSGSDVYQSEFLRTNKQDELPYSGLEIQKISETFPDAHCDILPEATESNFKAIAHDYALIHLAIHGESDTINKYNSKLIFKSLPSEKEDGELHAHEIYNLDLQKNQLSVLSACESGLGKQVEGEGIFSMARGFAYAGCPSIVMSLWKINDKSTSILMSSYYLNLSTGQNKDKALQLAKISFLDQGDELSAHPANWAAFIAIGNRQPLKLSGTDSFLTYLLISTVLLAAGLITLKLLYKPK